MIKKILSTTLLLFLIPVISFAALARQQAFTGSNTTFASTVTTSSVTVTVGNLIVCTAEADVVAANGITMTDSKSNTWTRVKSNAIAATFDLETWYTVIAAAKGGSGYTVTATDNGGGVDSLIICEEWSGNDPTPADQSAGATDNTGISGALDSGNTPSTTFANEVIFGGGVVSVTADTLTLGSGYSNKTQINTNFSTLGFESKTVSATGAYNATFSAGTVGSWGMQATTFKEAAPASTVTPKIWSLMGGRWSTLGGTWAFY